MRLYASHVIQTTAVHIKGTKEAIDRLEEALNAVGLLHHRLLNKRTIQPAAELILYVYYDEDDETKPPEEIAELVRSFKQSISD